MSLYRNVAGKGSDPPAGDHVARAAPSRNLPAQPDLQRHTALWPQRHAADRLGRMHAVPFEARAPHQRGEDRASLHHGEGAADAGARPEAERHELRARVLRLALWGEARWLEAVRVLPQLPVPVHGENWNDDECPGLD